MHTMQTFGLPQSFMRENLERPVNDQECSHCEVVVVGLVLSFAADGTYQSNETQFERWLQKIKVPSE